MCIRDRNPSVEFLTFGISQWEGNSSGYVPRYHQAWYLAGVALAAHAQAQPAEDDKRFHFGFVGALPIPEVNRQINAFTLGVRSVQPLSLIHI